MFRDQHYANGDEMLSVSSNIWSATHTPTSIAVTYDGWDYNWWWW